VTQGPPTAVTNAATGINSTTATFNGAANPNGGTTTGWFRYALTTPGTCNDVFGARVPSSSGTSLGAGTAPVAFTQTVSVFPPGTTIYYCAIASNGLGTAVGAVQSFVTDVAAPTVGTNSASPITGITATLRGSANPGGAATTGWFRYATTSPGTCNDTFGTPAPATGAVTVGTGTNTLLYTQAVTGLTPGTTYYYCAIAQNSVGTVVGSLTSFTTPLPPTAVTSSATSVGDTYATLNGSGNPNLSTTTGWFRYATTNPAGGCDDAFGSRVPVTSGGSSLGAGSSAVPFAQSISGLSGGTTYYYCAITSSAEGTSFGSILTFVTQGPPTAITNPATGVNSSTATLNGSASPNGASTTAWFRYSTTTPGTCSDTFGTRVPSSSGSALGSGTSSVVFAQTVSTFLPGTTYYFCAITSNGLGSAFGAVLSFTTDVAAPVVSTNGATAVTGTTATLRGTANPGGAATTGWFRYATVSPGTCNDTFGTRAPAMGAVTVGSDTNNTLFTQAATGLTPGTLYYYCAIATNSVGTVFGSLTTFTTPLPPTAATTAATSVGDTYATLNGTGLPNGSTTTGWFRYTTVDPVTCNDTFGSRAPTPSGGTSLGSGASSVPFAQSISGLSGGTTYYYCAIVSSAEGVAFGSVLTLRTQGPPSAATTAATSITSASATLNGSANPNGATSTGWFRYATTTPGTCNDSFGTRVPSSSGTSLGAGTAAVTFAQSISSLLPGTTYYFCAFGSNGLGTAFGAVLSFTTDVAAPILSTLSASPLTGTTATLRGSANPGGTVTTGWFRYDVVSPGVCNDTFGSRAPTTVGTGSTIPAGTSSVVFSQVATGLTPGVTYYYCALATNSVGTVFGTITTFTTPLPPVATTVAATSVTSSTAQLNGTGLPNGSATTGWFRYATTDPVTCNDTFGSRAPISGSDSLGSGASAVPYSEALSVLSSGATYYYCAIVSSAEGLSFGAVMTLRTQGPPSAATSAASSIAATSATLNGSANPNGATSTGWFRYSATNPGICNDSFGTRVPSSSGTSLGTGITSVTYAQSVTGLTPSATYYFCAISSNTYGTAVGAVLSFTAAAAAPTVSTGSPFSLTSSGATLTAGVNPDGTATTGWFRYDLLSPGTCNDTFGTRAPATGAVTLGSGTTNVSLNQAVTGLTAGATYYVCAFATNAVGTAVGSVVSFLVPLSPTVASLAATPVTSTTATLNGSSNPNGNTTTGWFRYSTTSPITCNDTFGTRAPSSGGTNLGAGSAGVAFSQAITGLTPGTLYYSCAIASSSIGTVFGEVLSFTTPSTQPTVTTLAASSIAPDSAVLNANANPGGGATTGWFRYSTTNPGNCTDSFGTRTPATGGTDLGSSNSGVAFTASLASLSPSTTYYYCAIASNGVGTAFGSVLNFNTAVPIVTTLAASAVTNTTATLNGSANPNGTATNGWFRYSTTNPGSCSDSFGTRSPSSGGTALGSGSPGTYTQALTGLTAQTTYYFCALASNTVGTNFGAVMTFITAGVPVVTTNAATGVVGTSAVLNGAATANSAATTAWFRYSTTSPGTCNDTFGTRQPSSAGVSIGTGTTAVPFTQALTGLTPGATYYVCALASNTYGTATGSLATFTQPTATPIVTTGSATLVTGTTAQLDATANPNGDATTGWFRYDTSNPGSCDDIFGTRAPVSTGSLVGSGNSATTFTQGLTGLTAGTTYYFCALASNSSGTSLGAVISFTTPAPPTTVTTPATALTDTSATLNGAATPNGATTVGWFRYGLTDPGVCNDTFGTRAPASSGSALGSGSSAATFAQAIGGLTAGTTYYYCALASNSGGLTTGSVVSFPTTAPPAVTTVSAQLASATSATLNGSSTPNGASTTGWFRYSSSDPGTCNDSFGTRAPTSGGADLGSGASAVSYSQLLSGLTAGTTYYYCAIASNASGTVQGAVLTFSTGVAAPTVTTNTPTTVTGTTATLSGSASPGGAATTGWFRYSSTDPGACNDTFGTRAPSASGASLGAGLTSTDYTQPISGLTGGTTYFVCAIASNSAGMSFGGVVSFSTLGPPSVTTSAATSVTDTAATLNGSANPNGATTLGWFRYGTTNPGTCSDTFGSRLPSAGGSGLGSSPGAATYSDRATGLRPGTTYFFCALASNTGGLSVGSVLTFQTAASPTVTTSAATLLTSTTATLNGAANPNGTATTGYFRFATTSPGTCDDTFGTRVPASSGTALGAGSSAVAFSQSLTGLTPGTTYFFCALGTNSAGTATGTVLSFTTTTLAPTVTTNTPLSTTGTTATLSGTANPGGAATTGWFRYSTTNPGVCVDTFGTRAPTSGGTSLGAGAAAADFTQVISGLAPGTTYFFCALASNSVGLATGGVLAFTTPPLPTVTTAAATPVAPTTATLNGAANPNNSATTAWFRYASTDPGSCDDTFGTRTPASGGTSVGAGSTSTTVSQSLTGLTPNTTYYFCALASSIAGTATGAVLSFRTPSTPAVTTGSATLVTSSSATLNGAATPNGATATGWFRYDATNPGTCNDTFGTRSAAGSDASLGSGTSSVPYALALSGLAPGTTYYFCALASNTYGVQTGIITSFTTPALAPVVTTTTAALLAGTTVQLTATATPNGAAATGWFRYGTLNPGTCSDAFGTRAPASGGTTLAAAGATLPFAETIPGLIAGTTYYYCAVASNSVGTSFGAVLSFATLPLPTATTAAATLVTSSGATLNGSATPNGSATSGWFRYSTTNPGTCDDTFGTRAPTSSGTSLGAGSTAVAYSQALIGLQPITTYYFCAIASNTAGIATGTVQSFRTPAVPSVTTGSATLVTASSATLNGTANPNGAAATAWFRYDTRNPTTCSDSFGTRSASANDTMLGAGTTGLPFTFALSGLTPGTTYYVCAIASNIYGLSTGTVVSFTTPALAPTVVTSAATRLTGTSVQIKGLATPNGDAATGWFRYGTLNPGSCSDAFGDRAPATGGTTLGSGSASVAFSQTLGSLAAGTTYYYCAVASNGVGTSFGDVLSFDTLPLPSVTTLPASSVTSSVATLNGLGTPNGSTTSGWFRYSRTNPGACDDAFGTRSPTTGGSPLGSGTNAVPFTQVLAGLPAGTTYYYCALASNAAGTALGTVQTFATTVVTGPPVVITEAAAGVTGTGATLNGTVDPNFADSVAWFRFSATSPGTCNDSFGTRAPLAEGATVTASGGQVAYSQTVDGLTPGMTYYFCAIASNAVGTRFGALLSFTTTAAAPTVTTLAPTNVSDGVAILNGSVVANGALTTAWFRYDTTDPGSCSDTFGTRAPATGQSVGSGAVLINYSQSLTGLTPGKRYYYCALASNAEGLSTGEMQSFIPGIPAPVVTTGDASAVTDVAATLAGTVNPTGSDALVWFRYGEEMPASCSDAFGTRAPATGGTTVPAGTTAVPVTQLLSALNSNTTYYFCVAASSVGGASFGDVHSFKTLATAPVVRTVGATSASGRTFVLSGSTNPRGSDTSAWFRYGASDPGTCSESFGVRTPAANDTKLGAGSAEVAFSQSVSSAFVGKNYFCAVSSNEAGTVYGAVMTFDVAPETARSGCNCGSSAGSAAMVWLVPLLLLAFRNRRRRA
jgi:hypothetical protein